MAVLTNRETLLNRLKDAEDKYHLLMTGGVAKVFVDSNGERIEFQQASHLRLAAYIEELRRQLGYISAGPLNVWM